MRLTTVILIATIMQVSASSYAQKMTYVKKNVSLQQLFKEITKQTGYNVFWYAGKVSSTNVFNANFREASLKTVMEDALSGLPLSYEISNNTVIIKTKEKSIIDRLVSVFNLIDIKGKVTDESGRGLYGAVIKLKDGRRTTVTDKNGEFIFRSIEENSILVISYLGYKVKEVVGLKELGEIILEPVPAELEEVAIVSTGYQFIPKERATGSFTFIDNKTFNRSVSPDIVSRLNGVTNGLLYQQEGLGTTISIRGKSTIFSSTQPLIIVDNFPFDGDISSLNPNDIESVTVLKDAAAGAIWGTRAGNGVIVFTTKKGTFSQSPVISTNANITVIGKPNLFYEQQLSSSEYIDIEKILFNQGAYTSTINSGYMTISPIVEILQRQKLGEISLTEANEQIDRYRLLDIRNQLKEYYYRPSINQQYNVNASGGSNIHSYFLSGGFDRIQASIVGQQKDRFTFKGNNQLKLLNKKLAISADYTFSTSINNLKGSIYSKYLPYDQIADSKGNALTVLQRNGLRSTFTDTVGSGRLLDWKYRPLDEFRNGYATTINKEFGYRVNLGMDYKIIDPLSISVNYQYYGESGVGERSRNKESFETRNLINSASYLDPTTGMLVRPIPYGDILTKNNSELNSKAGRVQLNFNKVISSDHAFNAIAGYERRKEKTSNFETTLYGYQPAQASSLPVDQTDDFPNYFIPGSSSVDRNSGAWAVDNNISYYFNASYGFKDRYILSGSFRKDESNLFGVKANQKGVPLWSSGLLWNIYKENFFKINWVDKLALRSTFGYNGNVNKNVTAYLTAENTGTLNLYQQNTATIRTAPNDNLRWEKVRNLNLALEFAILKGRLSGSFEFFNKRGEDLIGSSPIAPQVGLTTFTGNVASTNTNGFDVQISSVNINGPIKWQTTIIVNHAKDKVTKYENYSGINENIVSAIGINPIIGYPINSVFAYPWAGLDKEGNPLGILNEQVSNNYTGIINSTNLNELVYFGSSVPTNYGSVRNTLAYRFIELSFNISYKYGYFIRRNSINYTSLYAGAWNQSDFSNRWQNPGDELTTNIPKMVYPSNTASDRFYSKTAILVEKGDNIRLQDIQMSFNLTRREIKKLPFSNLNLYTYFTNLGVLWKSSKTFSDPDVRYGSPYPLSCSFGLKTNF